MKIVIQAFSIFLAAVIMSIGFLSSAAEAKILENQRHFNDPVTKEFSRKIMDAAVTSLLGSNPLEPDDPVLTEGYTELDLNQLMDNCQDETDTDEDDLPDEVEKVLGTDPESLDTDEDKLSDLYEATHGLDPLNPDTNSDGISDYNEILIYGEVEEGKNEEDYLDIDMDTDDDGTPNIEDRDNDGDSVPDGLDISPFSWGDVQEYYEIEIKSGPSATYPKYVDFQIQPEDLDDIYNKIQTYDWPYDQEGNLQDSDYSAEDMKVKPMAEIEFNRPEYDLPSDEDCVKYGMIKKDDKLWVSLIPVEDNGKKVALAGRVFVARGEITTQTLKIRLVWSMEFTNDRGTFQWSKQTAPFSGKKEWQGAGVETWDIDGNGKDDVIVAGILNGTATYSIWYTIGYDMDINGKVKGWSGLKRVPVDFPGNSAGGGVAVCRFVGDDGNVDSDMDIIFASVERKDGLDQWVYLVGYDLDAYGNPDIDDDGNPRWSKIGYGPELGENNSGAGIAAAGNFGGTNSYPDIVFMTIENADGADVFKYTVFWDFLRPCDYDPDSRNWNTIVQSNPIGWENSGGDVEITNLDSDSRKELVFLTVDNAEGANKFRYYIAWNIAGSGFNRGNPTGWSNMNVPPMKLGDRSYGAGLASSDFNGDGKKDILLLDVDDPEDAPNSLWYWVGNDYRGNNAVWSGIKTVDSLEGPLNGYNTGNIRELDCRMTDLDESGMGDMILGWAATNGNFNYIIGWDINSKCQALCWSGTKTVSLGGVSGQMDGLGFELYDIDNNNQLDLYVVFNDASDGIKVIIGWNLDQNGSVSSWSGIETIRGMWEYYAGGKGIGVAIESLGCEDPVDVLITTGDYAIVNTTEEQAYEYETRISVGYDLNHSGRITQSIFDNVMYLRETTARDKSHEAEDYDNNDKYYQIIKKQIGMGMVMYDFNHDGKSEILMTSTDDVNENGFRSFMLYGVARDESSNRVGAPENSIYASRNIDAAGGVYPEGTAAMADYRKLGLGTCVWDLNDNDNVDGISVMVEKEGDNLVLNLFTASDLETSTLNILEDYVPYRLTGLTIEESKGGEAAVIYNNDTADLKNNYTDALATYEVLWQYYMNNYQGVERDIEDALNLIGRDNGEDIGDFRQLSIPHGEIINFDHSDEAQSLLDDKIIDLDDEFNGAYSRLPIITCTTNSARQMTLDNLEQAKITSSKLTFNLKNIDFATSKLLQLKCFDFDDDEVVEIDGIIDLVDSNLGAGLADQEKAQLAQILIAHHMGELLMVRIGSTIVIPALTQKGKIVKYLAGSFSTLKKIYTYGRMVYVGTKVTGAIFSGSASIGKFIKNIVSFYKVAYVARMTQGSMWSLRNALDSHNFCGLKGSLASGPTMTKLMKWGNNLLLVATFAMSVYAGYQVAKAYDYTGYGFYAGAVYTVLTFALPLILFLIPKILTAVRAGFVATGFGALIIAVIELSDFITFLCCGKSWSQMAIEAVFNFLVGKGVDVEVDLKAIDEDLSYDKMRDGLFVMGSTVRDTSFWKGIVTDINRSYYNSSGNINENYMIPYVLYPQSSYYNTDNKAYDPGNSNAVDGWVPFTTLDNLKSKTSKTSFGYDEAETTTSGLITQTTSYKYDNSLEFKTLKANLPVKIIKEYEYKIHKWKKVMGVYQDDGFIHENSNDQTTLYFDVMPSSLREFESYYDITDQYSGGATSESHAQSKARMTASKTLVVQRDPDCDGLFSYGVHEKNEDGDILDTAYNNWDTDGDRVGDALEVMLDMDPLVTDTDDDGIDDLNELYRGTDPCKQDSDDDGLTDREEIDGWSITLHFNGVDIATQVFSNPLVADTDGDGLDDKEEYDGGTNPGSRYTPGRTLPDGEQWDLLWDGNQHAPSIKAEIPDNYNAQNNTEYSFTLAEYFQDLDGDELTYTTDTGEVSDDGVWKYTYSYTAGESAPVINISVTAADNRGTGESGQSFILADTTDPILKQATVVIRDGSNYYPFDRLEWAENVWGIDPDITVIFNEDVYIGDNFTGILLKDVSGNPIACTNTVSDNKIFVTPDAALTEDRNDYTLVIPVGAVKDTSNNSSENGYEGTFTTQDITPPQVIIWPADTTGIGPYDAMTVKFQEDIVRAWPYRDAYAAQTIGPVDVRVSDVNYNINIENRTVTFTLGADRDLEDNSTYKIIMEPGFLHDTERNGTGSIEFGFTTGDVNSPILIPEAWGKVEGRFLIDVDNATPVIELTYSEDLIEGVNFANIRLEHETKQNMADSMREILSELNDNITQFAELAVEEAEVSLTVPSDITIEGNKLRIAPQLPLIQNYLYRIVVPSGALQDDNGIETAVSDKLGVVNHSAGDTPTVIWAGSATGGEILPDELVSALNPGEHIGIVFNQPIYQNWDYLDGCPITLLDAENTTVSYEVDFENIRFDEVCYALRLILDEPMDDNSTYTLTIPEGTVKNLLNQPSAGYSKILNTSSIQLPGIDELKTFGLLRAGESLFGYFRFEKYNNMFGGTHHFQWYISSDAAGSDIQPIAGEDNLTFDIPDTSDYIGKYLWFEVTPQVENGENLFPCKFGPLGPIQSPFGVNTGLGLLEVKSVVEDPDVPQTFLSVSSGIQPTYDITVGTDINQIMVKAVPADPNAASWISNTPVSETDNTLTIPLNLDANLVTIAVTAENDIAENGYLLNIKRSLDNESSIIPEGWVEIINEGDIHPGSVLEGKSYFYDPEFRTEGDDLFKWYRGDENGQGLVLVGEGLQYRVTNEDIGFYLFLQMTPVTSRGIGGDPVLSPGVGPVMNIQLFETYDLTSLSVQNGTELINNFSPELTYYERSVGMGTTQVTVTAAASPAGAVVKVNGQDAAAPVVVTLSEGLNQDNITVSDGTLVLKTYLVMINRTSAEIPAASEVEIGGTPHTGEALTGSYQYTDAEEGGSQFTWYSADNPEGDNRTIAFTGTDNYSVQQEDEGKYLFFEVQPFDSEGTSGSPVRSEPMYITAYIVSTEPLILPEAAADNGSLDPSAVVISIAGGTFAEDIVKSDISASYVPAGLDFNITRTDDTHLTIDITGNAQNHGNTHDVDNLTFMIAQAKVTNAGGNLTTGNISIDFNNALQPAAPTNPEVDDDANTFGWTNVSGFADITGYEYSADSGAGWSDCTANPQPVGNNPFAAGNVQVRVKADSPSGRPAGVVLVSDQAFTTPLTKPGEPVLNNHNATWTAVIHENDGYIARLYKDSLFTGNTGEVAHGSPLSYDFSAVMDNPGDYTVTVIACGTGDYGDSPESDPSDPQIVLGTGGVDGQAQFSLGTTDLDLGNNASLDFQAGVQTPAGGQITVGGQPQNLGSYTGGALNNEDLTLPVNIGDQVVQVEQAVRLESGTDGQPIIISNSENAGISISIPDGTAILAGADWDGTMIPPVTVPASGNPPSGFLVGDTLIEVGSPSGILLFDQPVTITLEGVTGTVGYKPAGSDTWVQITQIAGGTYDNPVAPEAFGEAYISNGTDTRIITWHLSHFGSLDRQGRPMGVGGEVTDINKTGVLGHWLVVIILILSAPALFEVYRRAKR
jgi:hypothetical protein